MKNRVRPEDVDIKLPYRLKSRRQTEVRIQLYNDQRKIIEEWAKERNTSVTTVVRKLANYFLYMNEKTRERLLREY